MLKPVSAVPTPTPTPVRLVLKLVLGPRDVPGPLVEVTEAMQLQELADRLAFVRASERVLDKHEATFRALAR